jgi:hypoxanthine phosphoribosyltransferase
MAYSPKVSLYVSREAILVTVQRLAGEIGHNYRTKHPILLAILKGSVVFLSDLMRELDFPVEVDFVGLESYKGTGSTGRVKLYCPPRLELSGRHVLIVEDIVDTGLATSHLLKYLRKHQPASVHVCALLDKPSRRKVDVKIDFLGFTVPDKFLVGYGLDCSQEFRNLPDLYSLEER